MTANELAYKYAHQSGRLMGLLESIVRDSAAYMAEPNKKGSMAETALLVSIKCSTDCLEETK